MLLELEMNSDLKAALRELHFLEAKEVEVNDRKVRSPGWMDRCITALPYVPGGSVRYLAKVFQFI